LRAAAPYRGSAREILIAFKFRHAEYLGPHLARVMTERLRPAEVLDEVVAVPTTARSRLRQDHAAEVLAGAVARRLDLPWAPRRLEKIRTTKRQSRLPAAGRAANVRGAFRARGEASSRVLLVDDVTTSGATARECARTLLRAGTESVDVWCFARASRDDRLLDPSESLEC